MNKKKRQESDQNQKVFAFRWDDDLREIWAGIAERLNRNEPDTSAARSLIEEFISCFMTDEELESRGLVAYRSYPPPRIAMAMKAARENRIGNGSAATSLED